MVTPEALEALDLMCWLGHGEDAARLGYCNQSTISRRSQNALRIFKLKPSRSQSLLLQTSDFPLLRMEREVHQLYRLAGRGRLRLHAPYWASRLLENCLWDGWVMNPARVKEPVGEALALLELRVIDAFIAEHSQRPVDDDPAFVCFDLYQAPLQLCTVKSGANPLCHETNLGAGDVGLLASFQPFDFLSRHTKECGSVLFDYLYCQSLSRLSGDSLPVIEKASASFVITPTLALDEWSHLHLVDCECAFDASESLVVLREFATHPRICQLRDCISESYLAQISHHPGVLIHQS